jgi:hypothetical protein
MIVWRLQGSRFPLIDSEGARLTGGRWNKPGTAVIYASEDMSLAAMEVPGGWPDVVPEQITAEQGTEWVNAARQAVLRVPSATMSLSGIPLHTKSSASGLRENRLSFRAGPVRFKAASPEVVACVLGASGPFARVDSPADFVEDIEKIGDAFHQIMRAGFD